MATQTRSTRRAPLAPMPPGHPILGHLPERWRDPLGLFSRSQQRLGDVVRYRMGTIFVEQFTRPEHVGHILVDAKDVYVKGTVWDKLRPLIGNGVVTADGESWRRQRRLAQPAFHHSQLDALGTVMVSTIAATLDGWRAADGPVPLFTELRSMTLRVVIRALFGTELDAEIPEVADAFVAALEVSNRRIVSPVPYAPWLYRLPSPNNLTFRRAEQRLSRTVDTIIDRRSAIVDQPADLLGALIQAQLAEEDAISHELLHDEVMTFLLAGFETSATTMTWALDLLSRHPTAWSRLADEVAEVLGDRTPSPADLPRLRYTRAVVEETLRLRPALWAIPRMAASEDVVAGYRVPKGDLVVVVPYVTHRHPEFWTDPEVFDPARFLPERRRSIARWAYFPFGAGQRQCLGRDFALMEGVLLLAMTSQRFSQPDGVGPASQPDPYVTLRPSGDVPIRLRPR